MKPRSDLLDERSPEGLEVFQLTEESDIPGAHVYMEAQIFTPDSRRFLLERSGTAHGPDKDDPEHRYLVCDVADGCRLHALTEELGATAPSVTPDGLTVYYFVDRTEPGGGVLLLNRVGIDGTGRETLMTIDAPLPGTSYRPSRIYPLSTISSDGRRLATSAFLGDGQTPASPWGLMVFDLDKLTVNLVLEGESWCNMHPQYSRSADADASRDVLVQENHGNECDETGRCAKLTTGAGADIHVIRDDGTNFRNMPWGRDDYERCQGHQCWRGRRDWAITSTSLFKDLQQELIESQAVPHTGHVGSATSGGQRNDLSRSFDDPRFCHFATDAEGRRFITDCGPMDKGGALYAAEFGAPGEAALSNWTYLLNARSRPGTDSHLHPFLSPNGKLGFFNSNESGILQAYMVRGLPR